MTEQEKKFREIELRLDQAFDSAKARFLLGGLKFKDESGRSYHYKNEYLNWSYRFRSERPVHLDTEAVTIVLSYDEPQEIERTFQLKISIRAEVFSDGQKSQIDRRLEHMLDFEEKKPLDMESLVLGLLQEGFELLAKPVEDLSSS